MPELFTIGHSTHSLEDFLKLLQQHRIEAVADVRSSPFSARLPQFNRDTLSMVLKKANINYVFLGEELGARRSEAECYVNGVARYENIAATAAFKSGLERVEKGCNRFRLTLMCAEKDPLECHRTVLVCRHLKDRYQISHILADGAIETHADAEARLLKEEKVPQDDLFMSSEMLLNRAYEKRGNKIAYEEKEEQSPA